MTVKHFPRLLQILCLRDSGCCYLLHNVLAIVLPLASLTLTIMTIFDSAFKPAERFKKACKIGIEIQNFKGQLLADLQQLSTEEELNKYIPQKNRIAVLNVAGTRGSKEPAVGSFVIKILDVGGLK